jgi:recombination protein RecT
MEDANQSSRELSRVDNPPDDASERRVAVATAVRKPDTPISVLRSQLQALIPELQPLLPRSITPDHFIRVALTAVQKNPALLSADRRSFFESCMTCAEDGLLPDGREAALLPYKGKVGYLPMIAGIRRKVWNSGELASWEARIACENDTEFEIVLGDEEKIIHIPALKNRGPIVAVYSRAVFKSGFISRDYMAIEEVEEIRKRAQTQKIWGDPLFYPEMVKKTMLKRHAKALPLSAELDRLMRRDDTLYDMAAHEPASLADAYRRPQRKLSDIAALPSPQSRGDTPPLASDDGPSPHRVESCGSGIGDRSVTTPIPGGPPFEEPEPFDDA